MSKTDKIIELRKETSQKKAEAVRKAIKHLKRTGQTVTVSSVAREAKVGNNFIYKHPELKELIITERDKEPVSVSKRYHNTKSVKDMLVDECNSLIHENEKLKAQIEDLTKHDYQQEYEELQKKYAKLQSDYDALFQALLDTPQSLEDFGKVSANIDKMKQA